MAKAKPQPKAKSGPKPDAAVEPVAELLQASGAYGQAQPVSELPFERAFEQLAELVAELEQGDLPLEESLARFERGQALAARCSELLESAELKLKQLSQEQGGGFIETDFEPESDE
jgi:exodeoxyribonuclease VII small subunit